MNLKILRLERLGSNSLWLWLNKICSSARLEHFASRNCARARRTKQMVMNQKRWCSMLDERVTNDDEQWHTNHFSAHSLCVLHTFTRCDRALAKSSKMYGLLAAIVFIKTMMGIGMWMVTKCGEEMGMGAKRVWIGWRCGQHVWEWGGDGDSFMGIGCGWGC